MFSPALNPADEAGDTYRIEVYTAGAWWRQGESEPAGDDFHYSQCGATRGFLRVGEVDRTTDDPLVLELSNWAVMGEISSPGTTSDLGLEVFEADSDAFAMLLNTDREYWLVVEGSATGGGTLSTPVLSDVGNECTEASAFIETDADNDGAMLFSPASAGYHVVRVSGGGNTGTYTLSLVTVRSMDVGDSITDGD